MTHAFILLEKAALVLANRKKSYGEPTALLENVAKRWSLTLGTSITPNQVAMCLIDLKIARLNADPKHKDSVIDLAGYAAILNEIIYDMEETEHERIGNTTKDP